MCKRVIAWLLAICLCVGCGAAAFASGEASSGEPILQTEIDDLIAAADSADALHAVYKSIALAWENGTMLDGDGRSLAADPEKAAEYYILAGSTGDGHEYFSAGEIYEQGLIDDTPDYEKAMECYLLAAGAPTSSCKGVRNIGQWYDTGNDYVQRDPRVAAAWYMWAILLDDASSCYYLGRLYQQGDITWAGQPDYASAALYYQMAADKNNDGATGVAKAIYQLGYLYENGLGVEADPETALALYQRAVAAGEDKLGEFYSDAVTAVERLG